MHRGKLAFLSSVVEGKVRIVLQRPIIPTSFHFLLMPEFYISHSNLLPMYLLNGANQISRKRSGSFKVLRVRTAEPTWLSGLALEVSDCQAALV